MPPAQRTLHSPSADSVTSAAKDLLAPHQATFVRSVMRRSRSLQPVLASSPCAHSTVIRIGFACTFHGHLYGGSHRIGGRQEEVWGNLEPGP